MFSLHQLTPTLVGKWRNIALITRRSTAMACFRQVAFSESSEALPFADQGMEKQVQGQHN